jgi:hypothetical protein
MDQPCNKLPHRISTWQQDSVAFPHLAVSPENPKTRLFLGMVAALLNVGGCDHAYCRCSWRRCPTLFGRNASMNDALWLISSMLEEARGPIFAQDRDKP